MMGVINDLLVPDGMHGVHVSPWYTGVSLRYLGQLSPTGWEPEPLAGPLCFFGAHPRSCPFLPVGLCF